MTSTMLWRSCRRSVRRELRAPCVCNSQFYVRSRRRRDPLRRGAHRRPASNPGVSPMRVAVAAAPDKKKSAPAVKRGANRRSEQQVASVICGGLLYLRVQRLMEARTASCRRPHATPVVSCRFDVDDTRVARRIGIADGNEAGVAPAGCCSCCRRCCC